MCEFETQSSLPNITRTITWGESNKYRSDSVHYSTLEEEKLTLPFGFVKETGEGFTPIEIERIEDWLFADGLPLDIKIIGGNGLESTFNGIVTNITWMLAGSCVIGATFTLECSSRYWYKERMFDFDIKNFGYFTIMNHSKSRYTYMDVLIKTEDRTEVDNVTKLIKTMSESEQNKMLIFLQGVKFAEALKAQPVTE